MKNLLGPNTLAYFTRSFGRRKSFMAQGSKGAKKTENKIKEIKKDRIEDRKCYILTLVLMKHLSKI